MYKLGAVKVSTTAPNQAMERTAFKYHLCHLRMKLCFISSGSSSTPNHKRGANGTMGESLAASAAALGAMPATNSQRCDGFGD